MLVFSNYLPFSPALASENCSIEMSRRADLLLIDARGNWNSLLKHQRTFVYCDDGVLGEGYSDAVVNLFSNEWGQFDVFYKLSKKYPDFQRWAIKHIDATASGDDLQRIILNAKRCSADVAPKSLCRNIEQAATHALRELMRIR